MTARPPGDRSTGIATRPAGPDDAGVAAEIYLAARRAAVPAIPPLVHADDEVRLWFRDVVVPDRETWLAEEDSLPAAVMVLDGDMLDQLYVAPGRTGRGIGHALLEVAQRGRPQGLTLWTFQTNLGARRFYERHGFVEIARTDGRDNEEHAPDIQHAWHRHSPNRQ